jgi:hypothetical protein
MFNTYHTAPVVDHPFLILFDLSGKHKLHVELVHLIASSGRRVKMGQPSKASRDGRRLLVKGKVDRLVAFTGEHDMAIQAMTDCAFVHDSRVVARSTGILVGEPGGGEVKR